MTTFYEQRIVPIYDAIEKENYKDAVQLASRPDCLKHPLCMALCSYSHVSLHERVQGLNIAHQLLNLAQTQVTNNPEQVSMFRLDNSILETLAHTFRRCRMEMEVMKCYELMIQFHPNEVNENFQIEVFYCSLRLNEPKKMQLISQKLFKLTNKNLYLFWSIVSMQLQSDLPSAMLIVSEKMIHKVFYESSTAIVKSSSSAAATTVAGTTSTSAQQQPGTEELELFLRILVRQHKFTEAYKYVQDLLSRPIGSPITDEAEVHAQPDKITMHQLRKMTSKCDILQKNINHSTSLTVNEVNLTSYITELIKQQYDILDLFPDQYSTHTHLVDTLLRHSGSDGGPDKVRKSLEAHVKYLHSMQAAHSYCRGPYLAEVYLFTQLALVSQTRLADDWTQWTTATTATATSQSDTSGTTGSNNSSLKLLNEIEGLLSRYVQRFQTKQCCFSDVKPLVDQLYFRSSAATDSSADTAVHSVSAGSSESDSGSGGSTQTEQERYVWTQEQCRGLVSRLLVFATQRSQTALAQLLALQAAHKQQSQLLETHSTAVAVAAVSETISQVVLTDVTAVELELTAEDDDDDAAVHVSATTSSASSSSSSTTTSSTATSTTAANKKKKAKKKIKAAAAAAAASYATASTSVAVTKGGAVVSQTAAAATTENDVYRSEVVNLVCSLCKAEQLKLFLTLLVHSSSGYSSSSSGNSSGGGRVGGGYLVDASLPLTEWLGAESGRVALYECMKRECEGGVGGEREVQPGDELLLLCSAAHRLNYRQQLVSQLNVSSATEQVSVPVSESESVAESHIQSSSRHLTLTDDSYSNNSSSSGSNNGNNNNKSSLQLFMKALEWASLAMTGVEGSPCNFALRLEALEPLRLLGVGEAALVVYNKLGAKYIQNDSMTYLVMPVLLETGLTAEALRQNRVVCSFHAGARRDVAEMMTTCFKFGNYMKVLELQAFGDKCQFSSQLALSKAELPLLELIETHHSYVDACKYMQSFEKGSLAESLPLLTDSDLAKLQDNYDFNLLIRCDLLQCEESSNNILRKHQIRQRIKCYQLGFHAVMRALALDLNQASELLTEWRRVTVELSQRGTAAAGAAAEGYIQWSQSVDTVAGANAVSDSVVGLFEFYLHTMTTYAADSSSSATIRDTDTVTDTQSTSTSSEIMMSKALHCINQLKTFLSLDSLSSSSSLSSSLSTQQQQQQLLLDPLWIKRVSVFIRSSGSWVTLLLQQLMAVVISQMDPTSSSSSSSSSSSAKKTLATNNSNSSSSSGSSSSNGNGTSIASTSTDVQAKIDRLPRLKRLFDCTRGTGAGELVGGSEDITLQQQQQSKEELIYTVDHIKVVANAFASLLGQLWETLNAEIDRQDALSAAGVLACLQQHHTQQLLLLPTAGADPMTSVTGVSVTAAGTGGGFLDKSTTVPVLEQVMSAQRLSCVRFRDTVGAKLTPLRNLLTTFPSS